MNRQDNERSFGLMTAVAMIVGIVIGSGIFFKADDILLMTNGNVMIGCLILMLGAIGIIFGGLTIAEWAKVTDNAGGLISYGEKAFGRKFAFLIGWFQMSVYFPALIAIVCWVAANYTQMLFPEVRFFQEHNWLVSILYMVGLYCLNAFATCIAGFFQTSSMFIKLIPLVLIAILGVIFGDVSALSLSSLSMVTLTGTSSALVAAAFSYDGWSIAPSICHEIRNAKRNLPLALTIAPMIIMVIYIMFFLGISILIGPDKIIEMKDGAFYVAADILFGEIGARVMLICVIISVLGTANGIILGSCRIPHALALRNDLPWSSKIAHIHPRFSLSMASVTISFAISSFWMFIHYLTVEWSLISSYQIDVSGIPIVLMHMFYAVLYVGVILYIRKAKEHRPLLQYVIAPMAILGALLIIFGGFTSDNSLVYFIVSVISLLTGTFLFKKEISEK